MIKNIYYQYRSVDGELRCGKYFAFALTPMSQKTYDADFQRYLRNTPYIVKVPNQCIINLFGSDTWVDHRPWPSSK